MQTVDKHNKKHNLSYMLSRLLAIVLVAATLFTTVDLTSLNVNAFEWFDGTGRPNAGGGSATTNGASETRGGFLVYMVDASGNVIGNTYALQQTDFIGTYAGSTWHCTSRKGVTVSGWSGTAPWPVRPFSSLGDTADQLRAWMQQPVSGGTQGEAFISRTWGQQVLNQFRGDQAFLVVESITNFQWSVANGGAGSEPSNADIDRRAREILDEELNHRASQARSHFAAAWMAELGFSTNDSLVTCAFYQWMTNTNVTLPNRGTKAIADLGAPNRLSTAERDAVKTVWNRTHAAFSGQLNGLRNQLTNKAKEIAINELSGGGAAYTLLGDGPIIGTINSLIQYADANGLNLSGNWLARYTHGMIPKSMYVTTSLASRLRFEPYTGVVTDTTRFTSGDIKRFGLAMCILGMHDLPLGPPPNTQTTCVEANIPNTHRADKEESAPLYGPCTIIKSYRTKSGGTLVGNGTFVTQGVSNTIVVEDEYEEGNAQSYKLVAWKSTNSLNASVDPVTWESTVPGTCDQQGNSEDTVLMEASSGYKYLYVLLERNEEVTAGNYTLNEGEIARGIRLSKPDVFVSDTNTLVDVSLFQFKWYRGALSDSCTHYHSGCFSSSHACNNKYSHPHHSDTTCSPTATNPCSTHGTTPGSHCTSSCYSDYRCSGHHCSGYAWNDKSVTFALKNSMTNSYPNILATKDGWQTIVVSAGTHTVWSKSETESGSYSQAKTQGPPYTGLDIVGVIHRGQDKLTIAQWKNSDAGTSANTDLASLSSAGYRIADSLENPGTVARKTSNYTDMFKVEFADNSSDLTVSITAATAAQPVSTGCTHSINYAMISPSTAAARQAKALVYVLVYSGKEDGGFVDETYDSSEMITAGSSGNLIKSGRMVKLEDSTVNVYPYIQMYYTPRIGVNVDGSRNNASRRQAYVLGEYQRSFMLNAYAEVEWNKTSAANVNLESLQWSTHKMVQDAGFSFGEVLPGGATLNLTIPDTKRQAVYVTTYNPILAGAGKVQVEKTTGASIPEVLDFEKAKEEHGKYVLSVIEGLSSLTFQQWYKPSYIAKTSGNLWESSIGGFVVKSGMTTPCRTSSESKYYFKPITHATDTSSATEGDLDADVYNGTTPVGIKDVADKTNAIFDNSTVNYVTFWVDPKGDIRIASGSNLDTVSNTPKNPYAGTVIATRVRLADGTSTCQWVSGASALAHEIDDKTYIIRKLVLAFEKGGGLDSLADTAGTDGGWYNEAFDGVTYAIVKTKLLVGFADPGERSTVLDPLLCPPNDRGQAGMFQPSNSAAPLTDAYYTSQYKLMDTTNGYSEQYKIGVYREKDIKMNQFDYLFYSDKFWIPNVTVQDLK